MSNDIVYSDRFGYRKNCLGQEIFWTSRWEYEEYECGECGTPLKGDPVDRNIPEYHVGPIVPIVKENQQYEKCSACGETWLSVADIVSMEFARLRKNISKIFDRDSKFFEIINKKDSK